MSTEQWKAEYERLAEAVRFAIDYAGGRESEWGERAEECFRILETAVSRKPAQPQPAEDPDEWVIQDRVPVRIGDRCWWVTDTEPVPIDPNDMWVSYPGHWIQLNGSIRHGTVRHEGTMYVMCRRRDLPKVEQCEPNTSDPACPDCGAVDCERAKSSSRECSSGFEPGQRKVCGRCGRMNCESLPQPQKTRVRLFRSLIDGLVVAENECPDSDWQEIHHDSEGFYVEGGQS